MGRGRPRFPPDVACRAVLNGLGHAVGATPPYGALTPSGGPFQGPSGTSRDLASGLLPAPPRRSNPGTASPAGCAAAPVWAAPRSLAATRGILSLPRGTEMFQFPRFPPWCKHHGPASGTRGVAPFGDPRLTGCQRLPGVFRRVAASFLGRHRLGIHHALIFATAPSPVPAGTQPAVAFIPRVARSPGPTRSMRRPPCGARPAASSRSPASLEPGPRCCPAGVLPPAGRSGPGGPQRGRLSTCVAYRGAPTDAHSWPRVGGAAGTRTPDPRRAKAVLSQPELRPHRHPPRLDVSPLPAVGAPGLEPGASALSGPRSDHLSYAPNKGR